jgi:hypothetical protein
VGRVAFPTEAGRRVGGGYSSLATTYGGDLDAELAAEQQALRDTRNEIAQMRAKHGESENVTQTAIPWPRTSDGLFGR